MPHGKILLVPFCLKRCFCRCACNVGTISPCFGPSLVTTERKCHVSILTEKSLANSDESTESGNGFHFCCFQWWNNHLDGRQIVVHLGQNFCAQPDQCVNIRRRHGRQPQGDHSSLPSCSAAKPADTCKHIGDPGPTSATQDASSPVGNVRPGNDEQIGCVG